ncbi:germin-like protein 10 [Hibiscus trionum]|uniref:Germin-like protein n=1 Tax=Hibiscus trionum TaxID=183268 RepID=A0A9W7JAF9_HIBTR|nr:germin-like protein 10 [Hibiscus trionum]
MAAMVFTCIFAFVVSWGSVAADVDQLQDLCVADKATGINMNGFSCKNGANVTEADFFFSGLADPAVINNPMGAMITAANVEKIPGVNTLGISLARIDYQPGGLNPPHTHPRASEIIFVLHGELEVGFFTTSNQLVSKSVRKGDVFVFPKGLIHYQKNNGGKPASVIAGFNSQFPGTQSIAAALFTSTPPMPDDVLTKAFQIGAKGVKKMRNKLAPNKT